jgi:transcriptional regulator with XRE-family HTH domain
MRSHYVTLDIEEVERRVMERFPQFTLDRGSYVQASKDSRWHCTRHDLDFVLPARKLLDGVLAGACEQCATEILRERRCEERSRLATDERLKQYEDLYSPSDVDVIRQWCSGAQYQEIADAAGLSKNQVAIRLERFRRWATKHTTSEQPSRVEVVRRLNRQIGARIRATRKKRGWSVRELSSLMDKAISAMMLNQYESGIRRPGVEQAILLGELLEVSPAWILCLDEHPPPDDRERELIRHFRRTDERGRKLILQAASAILAMSVEKVSDVPDP